MKVLPGGCRVFAPDEGETAAAENWRWRTPICRANGADRITQSVSEVSVGSTPEVVNPGAEETLYIVEGEGRCRIDGWSYPVRPGIAVYIPPGAAYSLENFGPATLRVVHACCPEDLGRHFVIRDRWSLGPEDVAVVSTLDEIPPPIDVAAVLARVQAGEAVRIPTIGEQVAARRAELGLGEAPTIPGTERPTRTVREEDRELIRAGGDRQFRYLVHTDLGCRQITQFVGWIPTSKAIPHTHTYEEGIYILAGRGLVHVEGETCEFETGGSIYFPMGVRHSVENAEAEPIRLLGAFYPSGSPGAAYED